MRVTKTRIAAAIAACALAVPATATALFDDVPGGAFYADSVAWAADNNITTGKTATTFAPDAAVTRGEVVTFLKRYNDNVVDDALADLQAEIDALEATLTSSVASFAGADSTLDLTGTNVAQTAQSISLTAPADGFVLVNASAIAENVSGTASIVRCSIHYLTPTIDFGFLTSAATTTSGELQQLAGTRGYVVTAGEAFTAYYNCDQKSGDSNVLDASMSAIFAPT